MVGLFDLLSAGRAALSDPAWPAPYAETYLGRGLPLLRDLFRHLALLPITGARHGQRESSMSSANATVVALDGVHKWYGEYHALRNIALTVRSGERIVICGPSGSGKSTLIRCVNGLEPHDAGTITVNGIELAPDLKRIDDVRREVRHGVPELQSIPAPHHPGELHAGADLGAQTPSRRGGRDGAALLDRVRIPEQADKYPGQLSGGQQQRVRHRACAVHAT